MEYKIEYKIDFFYFLFYLPIYSEVLDHRFILFFPEVKRKENVDKAHRIPYVLGL